jgi:flagellar biosynthesis protein FlhF
MHVKRVFRPTVREALAAAREELGPGALVLSTELVPAPGWRGWMGQRIVRLTAAAERGESEPLVTPADLSADRPVVTTDRHVPERASSRLDAGVMDHLRAGVVARLVAAGMDRALAEAVTARLTDAECRGASDRVLRRALTAELEPLAGGDDPYERCEVFVGPPGVGKTTTVAKIAAQERLVHNRALNLVSADAFKAGAIEQLQSYAEITRSWPCRSAWRARRLSSTTRCRPRAIRCCSTRPAARRRRTACRTSSACWSRSAACARTSCFRPTRRRRPRAS